MPKYSRDAPESSRSCKARGSNLITHYKNAHEVGAAIKGMDLKRAKAYLQNVLAKKEAIPFKRHTGGRGRHAQGKNLHAPGSQVGWPVKTVAFFVDLLRNAEANAELSIGDFQTEDLVLWHVQVNRAPQRRRRIFRAHGRIGPFKRSPCHIEIILKEKGAQVRKNDKG